MGSGVSLVLLPPDLQSTLRVLCRSGTTVQFSVTVVRQFPFRDLAPQDPDGRGLAMPKQRELALSNQKVFTRFGIFPGSFALMGLVSDFRASYRDIRDANALSPVRERLC